MALYMPKTPKTTPFFFNAQFVLHQPPSARQRRLGGVETRGRFVLPSPRSAGHLSHARCSLNGKNMAGNGVFGGCGYGRVHARVFFGVRRGERSVPRARTPWKGRVQTRAVVGGLSGGNSVAIPDTKALAGRDARKPTRSFTNETHGWCFFKTQKAPSRPSANVANARMYGGGARKTTNPPIAQKAPTCLCL